jgi:hypothetical protein
MALTVDKVTAFITRGDGPARELLVFRHPCAGVQLPAGTVEPGETLDAAVLREAAEETGLSTLTIVEGLATLPQELGPDGCMIARGPVPLRVEPAGTALPVEVPLGHMIASELGRGITVRRLRDAEGYVVQSGYAQVGYDLYDIRGPRDQVLLQTTVGWLPLDAITTDVRRHLYHLRATAPTPDRWTHDGDASGCILYWTPLTADPGLQPWHALWLSHVRDQLQQAR